MHVAHCSTHQPLAGQPLAALIQQLVADDAELRELVAKLKAHLYRGIAWRARTKGYRLAAMTRTPSPADAGTF